MNSVSYDFIGEAAGRLWRWFLLLAEKSSDNTREIERRFERLLEEHSGMIAKICFYFADSNNTFEDLRQDTLLNLWRGYGSFRGESKEITWVYRVCFNTCVTSVRKSGAMRMPSLDEVAEPANMENEEDTLSIEIAQLHYCINMLGLTDKTMVMMQLDGRSYDEIAEVMGMNRNTVATRLRRAKQQLSVIMKKN